MSLEAERQAILVEMADPAKDYEYWWRYNSRWNNCVFAANLICSLGAAVSGLLKHAYTAGIFGAVLTAVLSIQKQRNFESETAWYGAAWARLKVLKNKTTSPFATLDTLKSVEQELNEIVAGEANKKSPRSS